MSEFLHVWRGNGNESLVLLPVKSLLRQLVTWSMAVGGWPVAALFAAITFCSMVCNFACQLWYKEKKDKWRIVKN